MKIMKYIVEFRVYHGTSENNAKEIVENGADQLFFTTDISRAKGYSIDGTTLRKKCYVMFDKLNDAKAYVRHLATNQFNDFLIEDIKPKELFKESFKKSSIEKGRSETIYITMANSKVHWRYKVLPPHDRDNQNKYEYNRFHKYNPSWIQQE